MKDTIYTIPVTEAFNKDCECPMCILEKDAETKYLEYFLGVSLMDPKNRIDTNTNGFCQRHFEQLYNMQENRLGLSLITATHLEDQNRKINKLYYSQKPFMEKDAHASILEKANRAITSKKKSAEVFIDKLIKYMENTQNTCALCDKLKFTMDRYVDVILYLFFEENDFRETFMSKKGFCLKHFIYLLYGIQKYLRSNRKAYFLSCLMDMQFENMDRLSKELDWFSKKFDYRNHDEPWGNSKDALLRTIRKLSGSFDLKS
jgi:hypothetical protein